MNLIKNIIRFYINSSLHVAISVCSLCYITSATYDLEIQYNFYLFIFFSTILGYNFIKHFGVFKFHYRSLTNKFKEIQALSILSLIFIVFLFKDLSYLVKIIVFFLGVITFFYEIPFEKITSLRKIKGIKIYIISFVWAITTVVLPLIESKSIFSIEFLFFLLERFLFVFVLILPFEIRDLDFDDLSLHTMPQRIGLIKTKYFGFICLILIGTLVIIVQKSILQIKLITIIILFLTSVFLLRSNTKRSLFFTAFWVEGIPIFWAIMLFMSSILF